MNEKQYVNAITRKIKCSGTRKKDIKRQLSADIALRTRQGESLPDIMAQMGSVAEVANSFNESIPAAEQKQYSRNKLLKILLPIVLCFVLLLTAAYWMLPKSGDIAKSSYFDQDQVEAAMKRTIELLDDKDYAALLETSVPQMQSLLNEEAMQTVRNSIAGDWGSRIQFGNVYMAEINQKNQHFAVGEITVTYENVSVTYRLTYDQDMKFAGIYIR